MSAARQRTCRKMVNGAKMTLGAKTFLGGVTQSEKFTELQFRQTLAAVERMMKAAGGAVPVVDPMAFLTTGLMLDKLNEISERLDRIEAANAKPTG